MIKSDLQLDAKGLACPLPIVRTKKAMVEAADGQVLEVQATDKGSTADLAAWAKTVGHQYIGTQEEDGVLYHYIRKCSQEMHETEKDFEYVIANKEILSRNGLILDVRETAEFVFGHVPGAKSIPMGELEGRLVELDKEQEIYVICRTGTRSSLAAHMLAEKGYTKVYNVLPGMNDWSGELSKDI